LTLDPNPHRSCRWEAPVDWDTLNVNVQVPDEPGFYAFTDHAGVPLQPSQPGKKVLYVGIATGSLRRRLRKYRTGDRSGISNMHRGGFDLFMSRAGAAHAGGGARVTHSVHRKSTQVTVRSGPGQPLRHHTIEPEKIWVRWAVDPRAAIEAKLIRELNPQHNTMHNTD
jgi:hypothetical protein